MDSGSSDVERDAGQVDPEIAERLRGRAREAAHEREGHGEAGRGGDEIVDGEAEHLSQMAHRGLAAIVLPVGVGDEADEVLKARSGGTPSKPRGLSGRTLCRR